ncbi:endonuclease/exonuclease/phosphatase family protein [Actinoplanes sp. NPDC020271]|uniref:endonuclease/exonuclease/phosphatase family protein n=1 Tax=Actinoplanes sp. NPDC020271 TaxID=3363896 RepID=UPI003791EE81
MPSEFVVVSLNVCTGLRNDLPPLRERAGALGMAMAEASADVVLLQEVWTRKALRALTRSMPWLPHVAWTRGTLGGPAGGLVICSRDPLGPARFTRFRGVRARRGSPAFRTRVMTGNLVRGVLSARLTRRATLLATTQLTSNSDGDWSAGNRHHLVQRAQLSQLYAALTGPEPRILGGDLNISADGALYPEIVADGWWDPFAGDRRPTYRIECLPPDSTAHRIDYMLVNAEPANYRVTATELLLTGPELHTDHAAPLVRFTPGR